MSNLAPMNHHGVWLQTFSRLTRVQIKLAAGCLALLLLAGNSVWANVPGGGTSGANVTLTDNGDGTVTLANGIISIHINKTDRKSVV